MQMLTVQASLISVMKHKSLLLYTRFVCEGFSVQLVTCSRTPARSSLDQRVA